MIWITGASGFVGGHLVCGLAAAGHTVLALGGHREIAAEVDRVALGCVSLDLANQETLTEVAERYAPKAIVHAAALADAARCEQQPELAQRANVTATANLLELARERSIPLIHISTDLVFDGNEIVPQGGFVESDQPAPRSVYASSKRKAEQLVLEYQQGTVCRVCLVYGEALGGREGFLGWMRKTLSAGEPLKLFADEWRTPIYAPDIAQAVEKLVSATPGSRPRLFHLGGPERLSRLEFGRLYAELGGFPESLLVSLHQNEVKSLYHRPRDVSFSNQLASRELALEFTEPVRGLRVIFSAGT